MTSRNGLNDLNILNGSAATSVVAFFLRLIHVMDKQFLASLADQLQRERRG